MLPCLLGDDARRAHPLGRESVGGLDRPQVALDHAVPARGQAESGSRAALGVGGHVHRAGRPRDAEALEPLAGARVRPAGEDGLDAHAVGVPLVGREGEQSQAPVLEGHRGTQDRGGLVDEVLDIGHRTNVGGAAHCTRPPLGVLQPEPALPTVER